MMRAMARADSVSPTGKHLSSDEEVEQASKYADIHDKILSFPQQYDTLVGERGLKLSGGEKQRVSVEGPGLGLPPAIRHCGEGEGRGLKLSGGG